MKNTNFDNTFVNFSLNVTKFGMLIDNIKSNNSHDLGFYRNHFGRKLLIPNIPLKYHYLSICNIVHCLAPIVININQPFTLKFMKTYQLLQRLQYLQPTNQVSAECARDYNNYGFH